MQPNNNWIAPEPVDRSNWPDAAIAAEAAAQALQEGRYQLGFAFARIAFEANKAGMRAALDSAAIGHQFEPQTPHFDEVAQQAQTNMFGPQDEQARPLQVPPSARCVARTIVDGIDAECHGVVAYKPETGWYHLHPGADHAPVVPIADPGAQQQTF